MSGCNCGGKVVHIPLQNVTSKDPVKPAPFGVLDAAKAAFSKDGFVTEEIKKKRMDVCSKCEHLSITRQCKVCLCFVDLKTKFSEAHCPKFKW